MDSVGADASLQTKHNYPKVVGVDRLENCEERGETFINLRICYPIKKGGDEK